MDLLWIAFARARVRAMGAHCERRNHRTRLRRFDRRAADPAHTLVLSLRTKKEASLLSHPRQNASVEIFVARFWRHPARRRDATGQVSPLGRCTGETAVGRGITNYGVPSTTMITDLMRGPRGTFRATA